MVETQWSLGRGEIYRHYISVIQDHQKEKGVVTMRKIQITLQCLKESLLCYHSLLCTVCLTLDNTSPIQGCQFLLTVMHMNSESFGGWTLNATNSQ